MLLTSSTMASARPRPATTSTTRTPTASPTTREDAAMGKLLDEIRAAVRDGRYLVSWHADERSEERGVTAWQLVAELDQAALVRERPRSKPNPSVIVRQTLVD